MNPQDEMVLGIPRQLFDQLGAFQGITFDIQRYLPAFLSPKNNRFMARSRAEQDPTFKQIIPYVLLVHQNEIFHYVRGRKSGEQRLVSKGSIGIGGHINHEDEGLFVMDDQAYRAAVAREVSEETNLKSAYKERMVALINDDSTEVGKVHIGVVHVFLLESRDVSKREAAITESGFLSIQELKNRMETLETWSQICLKNIDQILNF